MIFAAIAAVGTASGIAGFSMQSKESPLSPLTLANVEALTKDEDSSEHNFPCCPSPKYTGSYSNMVLDCSGCTYRPGYSGQTTSNC